MTVTATAPARKLAIAKYNYKNGDAFFIAIIKRLNASNADVDLEIIEENRGRGSDADCFFSVLPFDEAELEGWRRELVNYIDPETGRVPAGSKAFRKIDDPRNA